MIKFEIIRILREGFSWPTARRSFFRLYSLYSSAIIEFPFTESTVYFVDMEVKNVPMIYNLKKIMEIERFTGEKRAMEITVGECFLIFVR